jgi:energy-coupling factor transporter ATP-binding protein EcfA2
MIETLRIESFKSIAETQLDLGQVNVFIGANGSGKSNLLEALALLSAAASGKVDQSTMVWRGARASGYYRPMFEGINPDAEIRFEANADAASYRVALNAPEPTRPDSWHYGTEVLLRGADVVADRSLLRTSGGLDPERGYAALKLAETDPGNPASAFLKSLTEYSIYSPDTPILHGWVKDPQEREPIGLGGGRLAGALDELLDSEKLAEALNEEFHASIDWFGGFLMGNLFGGDELYFKDRFFRVGKMGTSVLGTNDVNEGVLYLAFLAVLGLHPRCPRLFAIENVDHGLNPLLAKRLMSALSERILGAAVKRQVFLTTHNPLVLDGLRLQDNRVRLFTVDRDNTGRSVIRRFEVTEKHREMAAKGWTLSRMWINKLIGGVPDV